MVHKTKRGGWFYAFYKIELMILESFTGVLTTRTILGILH